MPGLQLAHKLVQHLSPQQILQSSILQLTTLSLEQRIVAELEMNPALEMDELELTTDEEENDEAEDDIDWDEILNSPDDYNVRGIEDYSREDVNIQIAASVPFTELLMGQLVDMGLDEKQLMICDEILGNVNSEGYLTIDPILISDRMKVPEAEVEKVRGYVMRLNPAGIAALDLQETLKVQLDMLGANGIAMKVIEHHFEDFANRRFQKIMAALGCTEEELQEAIQVVSRLNPKPGVGETTVIGEYIVPDVIVEELNGEWVITLNDNTLPEIHISPSYLNMMAKRKEFDTETRQFARRKVEAGRWFIQAVMQRKETMMRVMAAILKRQEDFFRKGERHLKPMVLRDVAEDVAMDISTISRVTNGKYVQTPHDLFELKYFFSEGMTTADGEAVSTRTIKNELSGIIQGEDKKKPYNDDLLGKLLKEKGYPVARRTVAKYREQLKVPVARLRKEF